MAAFHHPVDGTEHGRAVLVRERLCDLVQQVLVGVPEQGDGPVVAQTLLTRPGQQLVQDRERVTGRAGTRADHERQHRRLVGDLLRAEDLLQQLPQDRGRHQAERVVVGARPDRGDDFFRLGGREHELQVRRGFLDQLEEGVEPLPGHHVRLIDDVDLEAAGDGRVERPLAQVPRVIHAAVGGRVDLDHVEAARAIRRQGHARLAFAARVGGGSLGAVQRPGQDARTGRLPAATRPAEQVRVIHPPGAERLPERLCDVVLALDLGERRRPVAAVERQARRGPTGPVQVHRNGAGHVACHDLTLAVPVRTPRTPARARVPLLPSGPGGVGGISAVRGVADQSSHGQGQVAPHPGGRTRSGENRTCSPENWSAMPRSAGPRSR